MKGLMMSLLAVSMLAGCALSMERVASTPIISEDGSKSYVHKSRYANTGFDRKRALDSVTRQSNALCPSGYTLINEERHPALNPFGMHVGAYDLVWQIKCNKAPS